MRCLVYYEDVDYRRRMKLTGIHPNEWPIEIAEVVSEGRSRAVTGIVHGKPATGGYQGWTGEKQRWFDDCLAQSKAYYLAKWGGTPYEETFEMPFNGKP